jgi:hypothetical protein
MRALPLNSTLLVLATMLVWSLVRGRQATWERVERILSKRAMLAFLLLGAIANIGFSVLAGYINPRDFVQDVVAARQFLKHATLYPADLPELGVIELSAPIAGREELARLPAVRNDLNTLTEPPAFANAHPPVLGMLMAGPVYVLGMRGSFALVTLLSIVLLYVSIMAILRELFPLLPWAEWCAVMGLVFGWYPVGLTLRGGQPSIVLFALITAGWLMLRRNRPWVAGGAIGLAACLHAFPAFLLVYFAIRSRRAFVSAIVTIAILSGAAAELTIRHTFQQWLATAGMVTRQFLARGGNLSLAGLTAGLWSGMGWAMNAQILAPAMMLLVAIALGVFLWPWNRHVVPLERLDAEYAVSVTAMLFASPIFWGRYLPIMLLPLAVLIRNWNEQRPGRAVPGLLAALTFVSFPIATHEWIGGWLTRNLGLASAWLGTAIPSFSVLAILLWLVPLARPAPESSRDPA